MRSKANMSSLGIDPVIFNRARRTRHKGYFPTVPSGFLQRSSRSSRFGAKAEYRPSMNKIVEERASRDPGRFCNLIDCGAVYAFLDEKADTNIGDAAQRFSTLLLARRFLSEPPSLHACSLQNFRCTECKIILHPVQFLKGTAMKRWTANDILRNTAGLLL